VDSGTSARQHGSVFNLDAMKEVCTRHGAALLLTLPESMIAVADNVQVGVFPINGLRHRQGSTSGWFIWAGKELGKADDFFNPVHAAHLVERCREVVPMLGLAEGWRFLVADGYEDVWFDASLLDDSV
jgi:hypothetical protein